MKLTGRPVLLALVHAILGDGGSRGLEAFTVYGVKLRQIMNRGISGVSRSNDGLYGIKSYYPEESVVLLPGINATVRTLSSKKPDQISFRISGRRCNKCASRIVRTTSL